MAMDRPEDELPPRFIEAAQAVVMMPPFATEEQTGKAIEAVRLALLKSREDAFEEADQILEGWLCRTCGHIGPVEHDGCNRWNIDAATPEQIRAAIRQHSQKGER